MGVGSKGCGVYGLWGLRVVGYMVLRGGGVLRVLEFDKYGVRFWYSIEGLGMG
jgi:hypothetical protein